MFNTKFVLLYYPAEPSGLVFDLKRNLNPPVLPTAERADQFLIQIWSLRTGGGLRDEYQENTLSPQSNGHDHYR